MSANPVPRSTACRPHWIEEFPAFNPCMYHWYCRLLWEEEPVSGRAALLEGLVNGPAGEGTGMGEAWTRLSARTSSA